MIIQARRSSDQLNRCLVRVAEHEQTRKSGKSVSSLVISPLSRIVASVAAVVVAACIGDRQILRQMQSPNQSKHHTCMKKGCMAAKCRQTAYEVQSYVITDAIGRNQHACALCLACFRVTPCFGRARRACVLCVCVLGRTTGLCFVFSCFGRPLADPSQNTGQQSENFSQNFFSWSQVCVFSPVCVQPRRLRSTFAAPLKAAEP